MFPGERKLEPKTPLERVRFNYQLHKVRFLHQLTHNADFQNIHHVIVDPDLRVYAVDHSRACRIQEKLLAPDDLQCSSRAAWRG